MKIFQSLKMHYEYYYFYIKYLTSSSQIILPLELVNKDFLSSLNTAETNSNDLSLG